MCAEAHAQSKLTLKSSNQTYNLDRHAFIFPDSNGEYTVRDIVGKYRNGEIKQKNKNHYVLLDPQPQWIVLPIINDTDKKTWHFDFGSLENGRTGILEQLLIYEANQKKILFNGLSTRTKDSSDISNNQYIEIDLQPQKEALFIFYLYPTDYKRAAIPLSLKPSLSENTNKYTFSNIIVDYVPTVIIVSILIITLGFIITSATGFVPVIIYYVSTLTWFLLAEVILLPSIIGLSTIAPITPIITSLLIGTTCLFTIPVRYSHTPLRFILFFCVTVGFVSIFLFTFFDVIDITQKYTASTIISCATLFASMLFLIRNTSAHLQQSNRLLILWILCAFVSQIIVSLEANGLIDHRFYYSQADKIALYIQSIIVFVGIVISIKTEHARKLMNYVRQNQKAKSILNAQKSKENTDHSRLLRVIEREREIMEELRARESERTEEMRNAKITADEANQAKSAFLAIVSHEIRTPMTGIMGMVRMLEDTSLSDEQKDFVMTIADSGQAMLALLNDILDFSKIEDGSMDLENIEFDLRRVLNSVSMLMKAHSDQKNLQLLLNIENNIPSKLHGDPTRLRQVILNLVGNALKFTSKGYVSITAKYDENASESEYHNIKFEVADTGLGISKEAQANLFTPFSQADSSISRKYGGTGLGLAICKTLVEAMGGEIILNSREGAGSTFSFTLPFSSEYTQEIIEKPPEKLLPTIKNKHFLVVDDNEINRKVIEGFLKKANHSCVLVEDGKSALSILENDQSFDALFLDIEMPNMSGIDLAGHVLENDMISQIPMVAVTGNVNPNDIQKYYNAGFKNHIAKPIEPEVLNKVIYEIASNTEVTPPPTIIEEDNTETDTPKKKKKSGRVAVGKTLDEVMLKGLKDGLGTKPTQDLIQDLFVKTDEIVEQFKELKNTKDKESAKMRAHELRGMAGNFGLKALSDKSNEIEKICKDEERPFDDIIPHIEDLSTLVERSKYAVKEFLES